MRSAALSRLRCALAPLSSPLPLFASESIRLTIPTIDKLQKKTDVLGVERGSDFFATASPASFAVVAGETGAGEKA